VRINSNQPLHSADLFFIITKQENFQPGWVGKFLFYIFD